MTRSIWRLRARDVIERVLSGLPLDAPLEQKEKAIRAAYPFGERAYHPYSIWLSEVRQTLGKLGKTDKTSTVRIDPYAVKVACDWCKNEGCVACAAMRAKLQQKKGATDWHTWQRWVEECKRGDALMAAMFADWLGEQGWPEEAQRVRQEASDGHSQPRK